MLSDSNQPLLVKNLSGILSPTFIDKTTHNAMFVYKNDDSVPIDTSQNAFIHKISNELNCNPDGWILFVSNSYKSQILKIIEKDFLKAYKQNLFNFSDKNYSETILFHNLSDGALIEFIDTSYGSLFFYDLMENIQEFTDKLNLNFHDFLCFELVNMSTNIHSLKNEDHGYEFFKILRKNNINYMKEVLI